MQVKSFKENLVVVIEENLFAAKWCLEFEKDKTWKNYEKGDRLGFPAAILLLSIIDTIGGYIIKEEGWNRFKILNDKFFENQALSPEEVKDLYDAFRNPLIHNILLFRGLYYSSEGDIFLKHNNKIDSINLKKLYDLCEKGTNYFKAEITENKITNKLENKIRNLFQSFDRRKLPPGLDSQIASQIHLSSTPISGTVHVTNKFRKGSVKHEPERGKP